MLEPQPEWTDTEGASRFLSIPVSTLVTMRSRKRGPPYAKVGTTVRYSYADLQAWMKQQEVSQ